MEEPNFEEIGKSLLRYANNCAENSRIGERNLIMAIAEMIKVLAWSGFQQKDLVTETKALNKNLATFSASSDAYSRRLIQLTWVLVFLTAALIGLGYWTINDAKEQTAIQNDIALNAQFFTKTNTSIINAMQNGKAVLDVNGGSNTETDLDNYLGTFDVIQASYDKGLLSEADFCDSFSYYINLTSQSHEVITYIINQQRANPRFFTSVADLEKIVVNSRNENCK